MNTLKMTLLAAVALTLAACSNDEEPQQQMQEIKLTASVPEAVVTTRAASNLMTAFSGEKIYLHITDATTGTQVKSYNVAATTGTAISTGAYYPTTGNNVKVLGFYPYQPEGYTDKTVTHESTTFSVVTDQSSPNGYKASDLLYASIPSAARQDDSHALAFDHKLTKIVVTVNTASTGTISEKFKIELLNVKPSVTFTAGTMAGLTASGNTTAITMATTSTTSNLSTTTQNYAAIIPPQTLTATTPFIKITLAGGASYTYSIPTDGKQFDPNTVYTYTVTLALHGIQVTPSVSDWGNTAATTGIGTMYM